MKFIFLDFDVIKGEEIDLHLMKTVPGNKDKNWVPAYHFNISLSGLSKPIGKIDIRIGYNENLYYGGHIGYSVNEQYRGNHYAAKAVWLLRKVAHAHEMEKLFITCNPDNIASRKTCEYVGANLLEIVDVPKENEMYQRGEKEKCIYEWVCT
ncbi:GNAT family N-acetyltransferase [Lederbergia citrea]|uniref:GNAT family N-acetyltransferase n=1 Tax=Lederbergia citrea TaxID=2833581 RepID=A0A942UPY1_9BACI|nr:GNAT family N-acetyltransferase [Lederbergia citrea]MBS4179199.1 GNAT family N-acetyltransferase [Lederbergia citrea]MBS4205862.1 GNAT family N-acetyltransferase [Lederbergia citrea]MBS4224690.1 GNAT family N-acetyltransferase [Lederbergia citrea]